MFTSFHALCSLETQPKTKDRMVYAWANTKSPEEKSNTLLRLEWTEEYVPEILAKIEIGEPIFVLANNATPMTFAQDDGTVQPYLVMHSPHIVQIMAENTGFVGAVIAGFTGRDAETRTVGDGIPCTNFSLATEYKGRSSEKVTTWWQMAAWRGLAQGSAGITKGSALVCQGNIHLDIYTPKNGGDAVPALNFDVKNWRYLPRGTGEGNGNGNGASKPAAVPAPVATTAKPARKLPDDF